MKYLFFYIVCLLTLFNSPTQAGVKDLPEDFEGYNTRLEMEKIENEEEIRPSFGATVNILYEIGEYIYTKYTIEEIADPKFIEVLRQFLPEENDEQLEQKRHYLEIGYYMYEKVKQTYNKVISYKLVPEKLRKIRSDNEYDHPNEVPYKEAPEGKFYVVHNFKKFLTYSQNADERQSIIAYERENQKERDMMDKLNEALQKIEWKKIWFYGYKYKNPLLSDLGISQWQDSPYASVRLISPDIYTDKKETLNFGIQIITRLSTFVLANNIDPLHLKPQINLSQSTNVKNLTVTYPIPLNSKDKYYAYKYYGDFIIPITAEIADVEQPVTLKGEVKLSLCDTNLDCDNKIFPLELTVDPSGDEFLPNGLSTAFSQDKVLLPKDETKHLRFKKMFIDKNDDRQIVHLQFSTDKKVQNFKVFIEENGGYTRFNSPFIRLHDDKIDVNFEPIDDDKDVDLIGSKITVTASLNTTYNIRLTQEAEEASSLDPDKASLNWGIIFFAVLGGFILNFMPCVFPILSLKIISFSRTEEKHRKLVRHSLKLTCLGIYAGFTVLICALLIAKYLGYSLGWGMQFQNLSFLIVMTFVLACFVVLMPSFNFLSRFTNQALSPKTTFWVGTLIVLLSTPCTGPYLATAIGFALAGTYSELIIVLYAVAFGLSLPYLITLFANEPEKLFPKPGKWMSQLHFITQGMLYLTILWFFSLIWGQTDNETVLKIFGLLILFVWIFSIHHKFQQYLEGALDEQITDALLKKIKLTSHFILALFFILCIGWSTSIAKESYEYNHARNMVNRQTEIDKFKIQEKLSQGHSVLLEIGADWCMTCHVNNFLLFNKNNLEYWKNVYNLDLIKVDWTNYNKDILDYMEKYGRKGLPFYILYTPYIREGLVLPEIFGLEDLQNLIYNSKRY